LAPPQTPLGEVSAPPDPLAGFKGPTFKWREGREGERGGKERGVEGLALSIPTFLFHGAAYAKIVNRLLSGKIGHQFINFFFFITNLFVVDTGRHSLCETLLRSC